jgi:glycosyltransferase involved in cell wall biosynthesis
MRILHVIDQFHMGGSEEHATFLAQGLEKRGHQCSVVAVSRPDQQDQVGTNQKQRLSDAAIPFHEVGGKNVRRNVLYVPLRLRRIIRRFGPDLVHSHTDIPDLMVSMASRLGQFPVARTIHNTSLWETRPRTGRICEGAFHDDLIVAVSQDALAAHRELRRHYGLSQSAHQSVVLGSVPDLPDNQDYQRSDLVRQIGADGDKLIFCFAGRLVEQKGFDVLIEALSRLDDAYRDKFQLHAFTAGDGLEECKAQVQLQNLPVVFHPPLANISRILQAFDAILMPSRWEGYGRVAAEGFLSGTPVIASDTHGLRETFPPQWPLKVPADDSVALSDLLIDVLEGRRDLNALGASAREWARPTFSVDREVDDYETRYLRYLNR